MTNYSCESCGKEFTQKSHYDSHKKRKKPCEKKVSKIEEKFQEVDKKFQEMDKKVKEMNKKIQEPNVDLNCELTTFKDLYEFLQKHDEKSIIKWLKNPWKGKDKQESLLRLFTGLGLINKLNEFHVCKGNFNLQTITKQTSLKEIFYDESNNLNNLKDKGDSSDLTCISKKNDKHLLATTSKNNSEQANVGGLDIDKILTNFEQYKEKDYSMSLCIAIRNIHDYEIMKNGIEKTNKILKTFLDKEDTIIIDWSDLNQAYNQFKLIFANKNLDTIINSNKNTLCLKMHQRLSVQKTLRMKNSEKKTEILWGHIQRSGKSYIIGGCIIEDSIDKEECNYLIITTAPNETIEQQRKVVDCLQLQDFNIVVLNGKNKKPILTQKNIIICSKQFLQTKIEKGHDKQRHSEVKPKSIDWLKKISFDMRFLDESHNGGTTELAQQTLNYYGKNAFTVQITATYSKPINDYNIPKDSWILWDLEDIKLCKNIEDENSINRLVEKHGEEIKDIIEKYSPESIITEYSKYPDLWILTDEIISEIKSEILNDTKNNNYGWSPEACFLLKQAIKKVIETGNNELSIKEEFQNEAEMLKIWYRIFGKKNKFGIPDKDYPDETVFMKRIEKICKDPTIDSRFIGEGDFNNEPMIIMAYLPQNNIDKISNATINLLEKYNIIPDYDIISINSKITNNPKQEIENARNKARINKKKGVLVLSGKQCSLAVSIDNCDIVLLLNNNMGFDMIYQMMFRSMTEGKNKKCGFVVDLNIHRVIETSIINYASLIKPDLHPKEAVKYILQERLINLNGDHWMPSFGNNDTKINNLCENVYELYSSNTEIALNHFLSRLSFKSLLLTKEEQTIFNAMFSNIKPTRQQRELIDKLFEDDEDEEEIKKGIEKTKVENSNTETDDDETSEPDTVDEKKEEQINYMDILKHIIPLICLLTIHNNETSFIEMFNVIETDKYIYNILIDQTKSWWGKSIDSKIIKKFIHIYIKYMKDDKETNQIIRTVKELFMKNIKNNKELSSLIDKYLIPQELEKKSNAEVSTPFKYRQKMLDKIPIDFWKSIKKVFEPCAGKGGFIIDIIDRFMIGLKDLIPDEKNRYKTIVEKCLYFSDINSTNIFICKLLIDPYNNYKLNYNEGNTLELDINEKWGIDHFNAVIGNPPYNEDPENSNDPHMKPLYQDWIYKFTEISDMLLFITPSKWFTSQDKLLVELRNYMKNCKIEFIEHYPGDDLFKNVKIKGGVSYYLINKSFNGETKFNDVSIDLNKYDVILEPKYYKLITKIKNHFNKNLSEIYCSQGTFVDSKREKEFTNDKNDILCYVSKNKGLKKYLSKDKISKDYNYWKLITPAAAYKGSSGFSDMYILDENEIHSRSYVSFKVNNKDEAENLLSYMKCKLTHILLSIRKQTHNLCNKDVFTWIPYVPLDRKWNNAELYKYLNLDEDDIKFIEGVILEGTYNDFN